MQTLRAALLVLVLLGLAACGRTTLYANLDERQANQIHGVLLEAGMDAVKRPADNKKGWTIDIAPEHVPGAMRLLQAAGLPSDAFESMGTVFRKEGFVSSPLELRARYLYAISQELAYTLEQIDGVVMARVHIALPEPDRISGRSRSASASVAVFHQPEVQLADRETDIKALVTDAVEDLDDVNKVTVKFFERPGPELPAGPVRSGSVRASPMALMVGVPAAVGTLALLVWGWVGSRRGSLSLRQRSERG